MAKSIYGNELPRSSGPTKTRWDEWVAQAAREKEDLAERHGKTATKQTKPTPQDLKRGIKVPD
jgi:hypothetical protein